MSGAVQCIDCTSSTAQPGLVFSPDNSNLIDLYEMVNSEFSGNTNTFALPKEDTRDLLLETYLECSAGNWDGEGALPVKIESYLEALEFIDNLSNTIPMPSDISADSSGYISMEWRKRKGLIFDISFKGNNEVIYAGLLGTSKPRGVLCLGRGIPRELIDKIEAIGT